MSEITLSRDARLTLRSQAHHLDPVVLLGANGLTEAVMKEIDRALKSHELIKVKVPTDDREERESIFAKVADELGAARVQMIGKLLILWRPAEDEDEAPTAEEWIARAASAARGEDAPAPKAKKVASKKPAEPQPRRRARPKTKRTTKKAALST